MSFWQRVHIPEPRRGLHFILLSADPILIPLTLIKQEEPESSKFNPTSTQSFVNFIDAFTK